MHTKNKTFYWQDLCLDNIRVPATLLKRYKNLHCGMSHCLKNMSRNHLGCTQQLSLRWSLSIVEEQILQQTGRTG